MNGVRQIAAVQWHYLCVNTHETIRTYARVCVYTYVYVCIHTCMCVYIMMGDAAAAAREGGGSRGNGAKQKRLKQQLFQAQRADEEGTESWMIYSKKPSDTG